MMRWSDDPPAAVEPRSLASALVNQARQRQHEADRAIAAALRSQRHFQALNRRLWAMFGWAFALGMAVGWLIGGGR